MIFLSINTILHTETICFGEIHNVLEMKDLKRHIAIVLIICMVFSVLSGCSTNSVKKDTNTEKTEALVDEENSKAVVAFPAKTFLLAQLQEDFRQLQSVVETRHPKLFTNEEELDHSFETQYQLIRDGMDEVEFYRVLSPIVEKINCVHTFLEFSKEYRDFAYKNENYLPLTVKIIDDRAYVHQSLLSSSIPVGSEILSINGRIIKDIISIFLNNISADGSNTTTKYYLMNDCFSDMYFHYVDNPEQFSITYKESPDSKTIDAIVTASSKEQIDNAVKEFNSKEESNNELYSQAFVEDYAILSINYFDGYNFSISEKYKEFVDDFFSRVANEKIPNVILDLRDNWGGDPYGASHLFSYLISKASPYYSEDFGDYYEILRKPITPAKNRFKGKLFTLINGASSSTTGHLCALLRFHEIGTFLGEESGGSFACTDGSENFLLINTKIKFRCATKTWKVAVSGLTPERGIMPDHIITPTIQDYLDGKDVVKEFAIALFKHEGDK